MVQCICQKELRGMAHEKHCLYAEKVLYIINEINGKW